MVDIITSPENQTGKPKGFDIFDIFDLVPNWRSRYSRYWHGAIRQEKRYDSTYGESDDGTGDS